MMYLIYLYDYAFRRELKKKIHSVNLHIEGDGFCPILISVWQSVQSTQNITLVSSFKKLCLTFDVQYIMSYTF